MGNGFDLENLDVLKLAKSIERDCQEGVKWEIRKLQWILEEEQGQIKDKSKAA